MKEDINMKAAVFFGKEDVRVVDVEEPQIEQADDVKIKVVYCGICGSDTEEYLYGPIVVPTQPHPLTEKKLPLILGHEFTGVVSETGKDVKGLEIGDEVVIFPVLSCGNCDICSLNTPCVCEKMACMGLGTDGAFAEYIVVPAGKCYKLPRGSRLDILALTEPAAVAYHALKKAELSDKDNILIMGAGTIGLFLIQIAKNTGARIYVTEVDADRRELAKKMGASVVLNPDTDDIEKEVKKLSGSHKINKVIVSVGDKDIPGVASMLVAKKGLVVLVGISPQPCPIDTNDVVISEKVIMGSHGYVGDDFVKTIDLLSTGAIETQSIITKKISLDDIVTKGFEKIKKHPSKNIKILVSP